MDIRKVKKLIELLEASDVAEIEIKEGEEAVRISRNSTSVPAPVAAPAAAPPSQQLRQQLVAADEPAAASRPATTGKLINSPMVGTLSLPVPFLASVRVKRVLTSRPVMWCALLKP